MFQRKALGFPLLCCITRAWPVPVPAETQAEVPGINEMYEGKNEEEKKKENNTFAIISDPTVSRP